jgi:hypothetical protein
MKVAHNLWPAKKRGKRGVDASSACPAVGQQSMLEVSISILLMNVSRLRKSS